MTNLIQKKSSKYFTVTLESHVAPTSPIYTIDSKLKSGDPNAWITITQNLETRHLEPMLRQTNVLTDERATELIAQIKDAQRICKQVNTRMDEYFEAVRATIPSKAEH